MKRYLLLSILAIIILLMSSCKNTVHYTASFSMNKTTAKVGETITFTYTSKHEGTNYTWSFGDQTVSNAKNPTHSYSSTGTFEIILVAYWENYEWDTDTKTIIITP